jgi:REP element-mobilizing transposase RayT
MMPDSPLTYPEEGRPSPADRSVVNERARRESAYLITFTCYGAHLHGDESGSVDRSHNKRGTPLLEAIPKWEANARERMSGQPYVLNAGSRAEVLAAIREVCEQRKWQLLAAHVRTTHVHAVVEASASPETVMHDFKVNASRRLNELFPLDRGRRRWTRHGGTRRLWTRADITAAVRYVVGGQGEAMAVFELKGEVRGERGGVGGL